MKNIIAILFISLTCQLWAQDTIETERITFTLDTITTGLEVPWSFEFLSDSEILIAERGGKMKLFNRSNNTTKEISGLPEIISESQGGLLDLRVHPDYKNNGWIYFTYSSPKAKNEPGNGQNTAVMRARLEGTSLVDQERIFKALPNYETNHHFGGRITFDKEGYLFLSVGDRGGRDEVQNYNNYRGKILRLNDDGSVPEDNPYVGRSGYNPEIYTSGHRNPQGMLLNEATGEIWVHEHGPRGGDEVNRIVKGNNYGWVDNTYGINYSGSVITEDTEDPEYEQPVLYWLPSIAPCGFEYVSSDKYPQWQGDMLAGSLKFLNVERLNISGNRVMHREEMLQGIGRVRTIRQAPDGYLYLCAESTGVLVKIVPE